MEIKHIDRDTSYILRGLAAASVVTGHYAKWYGDLHGHTTLIDLISTVGRYGVAIFLFLSAYGLIYSHSETKKNFALKRILMVYVPYLVWRFAMILQGGLSGEEVRDWLLAQENWYIFVQLILYAIFFVAYRYCGASLEIMAVATVVLSIALFACGKGEAWYLSNICFIGGGDTGLRLN